MRRLIRSAPTMPRNRLLWLPPLVQEVFSPYERVIECSLLSGLDMRRFQELLAGMVICGLGPSLSNELCWLEVQSWFPVPDLFDHFAHASRCLLALPSPDHLATALSFKLAPPVPDARHSCPSSSWPISRVPFCLPAQLLPAIAAF